MRQGLGQRCRWLVVALGLSLGCRQEAAPAEVADPPGELRLQRLTHLQWENAVVDLLHLGGPSGYLDSFVPDPVASAFDNDAANLWLSPTLWAQQQEAAEGLAARLVTDLAAYRATVPQDPRPGGVASDFQVVEPDLGPAPVQLALAAPERRRYEVQASLSFPDGAPSRVGLVFGDRTRWVEVDPAASQEVVLLGAWRSPGPVEVHVLVEGGAAQVDQVLLRAAADPLGPSGAGDHDRDVWLVTFGRRVWRRPLTNGELEALRDLFRQGATFFGSGDDFADGVRAVTAALLQSPHFLYRQPGRAGLRAELSPYELVTKLSFALGNTPPDDQLLDAASDGVSEEELPFLVERLLGAATARSMVRDFHRQLLYVDNYGHIERPDEEVLGDFADSTPAAMQEEVYAFVDALVFREGTVRDLLLSRRTFVEHRVAERYGLQGVEATELVPVDLDPAERAGLLTLSGFLSWQAEGTEPNLIGRGAFVARRLLCLDLPPPPPGVPPVPPQEDSDLTLRQLVAAHTEGCGGACHQELINPLGFAFTGYDGTGRVMTSDHGRPIDASGSFLFEDGRLGFDGAVQLSELLAERPEVHRCYAEHLLGYLEGRTPTEADLPRIEALGQASQQGRPILDLVRQVVLHEAFRSDG